MRELSTFETGNDASIDVMRDAETAIPPLVFLAVVRDDRRACEGLHAFLILVETNDRPPAEAVPLN